MIGILSVRTGTLMTDGGVLHIEDGLPQSVLDELRRRGHVIRPEGVGAYGGYQAIWRDLSAPLGMGVNLFPSRTPRMFVGP